MLNNIIIANYFIKNILIIFLAIFFIITFIVIGNAFATVLNNSVEQNLDITSILLLVLIKSSKDLPLIITLSITLATTITINKIYKDSEISAINNAGVGDILIFKSLMPLIIFGVIFTATISLFIAPNLQALEQKILSENATRSDFSFIQHQKFQEFKNGNIMLYASGNKQSLGSTFIYNKLNDSVVLANDVSRFQGGDKVYANLTQGKRYQGITNNQENSILEFDDFSLQIFNQPKNQQKPNFKSNAKTTTELFFSSNPNDKAELSWRFALPISIIFLVFIAIILAKTKPRATKNFAVLFALIFFVVYINGLKVIKNLIANDEIGVFAGNFIVNFIFIGIVLLLFLYKNNKLRLL
jgi:lipopolysaccharide export system permease protein